MPSSTIATVDVCHFPSTQGGDRVQRSSSFHTTRCVINSYANRTGEILSGRAGACIMQRVEGRDKFDKQPLA